MTVCFVKGCGEFTTISIHPFELNLCKYHYDKVRKAKIGERYFEFMLALEDEMFNIDFNKEGKNE